MTRRLAQLEIEEVAFERVGVAVAPETDVVGIGPTVATLGGGMLGVSGTLALACPKLQAKLAICAGRQGGVDFIQLQVDIRHGSVVAACFALSLDDYARLLERMAAPLALARFEASHRDGVE